MFTSKCFRWILLYTKSINKDQNENWAPTISSFCADTTFVQTPLNFFLFILRVHSRYLKGTPELALYASKKIGTIRCTDRIILKEKWRIRWSQKWSKNWAGNFSQILLFWGQFFFQNALKNFLLAIWWCSRYAKGVFNLVLCARKKIMIVRYVLQNIFKKVDPPPSTASTQL